MSGITDTNLTDSYDQSQMVLMGGTDNTKIGNVGDRLKVDGLFSLNPANIQSLDYHARWDDLNASNGGVARDTQISTTYTNVYSYTNKGYLFGFVLSFEDKANWQLQLLIDGYQLFCASLNGIYTGDLMAKNIYGWEPGDIGDSSWIGWDVKDDTIKFRAPEGLAIRFETSLVIKARHISGTKKFRAGLLCAIKGI